MIWCRSGLARVGSPLLIVVKSCTFRDHCPSHGTPARCIRAIPTAAQYNPRLSSIHTAAAAFHGSAASGPSTANVVGGYSSTGDLTCCQGLRSAGPPALSHASAAALASYGLSPVSQARALL